MGVGAPQDIEKRRSVRFWAIESPTYSFSTSLSTSLAQPMGIRFLGMGVEELGVLTALQLGSVGLGAFFGNYVIAAYRHRRKRFWTIFGFINRVGWASILAATAAPREVGVPMLYTIVAISQFSGAVAGIAWGDVIGDLVERGRAARLFGLVSSANNLAALASLLLSVAVFLALGGGSYQAYLLLYAISMVSAAISTTFLVMIRDDPVAVETLKRALESRGRQRGRGYIYEGFKSISAPGVRHYIAAVVLYTASVNIPASLWNYYLIYSIGGDEVWIVAKAATTYIVKAIMLHIWPRYIQRYGVRRIFTASLIGISPVPVMFIEARSLPLQIALEVYAAIWWSSWDLCTGLYNLYLLPGEGRASILSIVTLTTNIAAAVSSAMGSLAAAAISPHWGIEVPFLLSTISRISVALAFFKKIPILELGR